MTSESRAGPPSTSSGPELADSRPGLSLRAQWELLTNLVARDLKGRYKGSVLGFLWALLTPLFMAAIYIFFLRLLVGRGVPVEEVIIGVFAWTFTAQAVQGGMLSVTSHGNLVKKVAFPRIWLPAATTVANLVNYGLTWIVQLAVIGWWLWRRGAFFTAWAATVPLVVANHFALNLALAVLLSASNVYFRDTQHLVGVGLSAWFFLSPVMYNWSMIKPWAETRPWVGTLLALNPLTPVLTAYRAALLPGVQFPWTPWMVVGWVLPWMLLVVAVMVFRRAQRNFADWL